MKNICEHEGTEEHPYGNHHRRFPFLDALPPARSAFSVRRARCLDRSARRAPFVWYLTFPLFFDLLLLFIASFFGFSFSFASTFAVSRCDGVSSATRSNEALGGPCRRADGSKSSTTVTVASCSSPSNSSSSSSPDIPSHSSLLPGVHE